MGGKTQGRVAGNVKPSSSGRIRDLLINKHGTGGIITFSALASNTSLTENRSSIETTKEDATIPEQPVRSILSSNDKATLIVRKVGNRECFTRVRFTEDTKPEQENLTVLESTEEKLCDANTSETSSSYSQPKPTDEEEKLEDEEQEIIEEVPDFFETIEQIENLQSTVSVDDSELLLSQLTDDSISSYLKLIGLMKTIVEHYKEDMSLLEWDLINMNLNKWLMIISRTDSLSDITPLQEDFSFQVLDFLHWLLELVKRLSQSNEEQIPMNQVLQDEWANFYSSPLCRSLMVLYFQLIPSSSDGVKTKLIDALATILIDINASMVINDEELLGNLNPILEFDADVDLPANANYSKIDKIKYKGFDAICNLFKSKHRVVVVIAHSILAQLIASISSDCSLGENLEDSENVENLVLLPPTSLMCLLTSRDFIVSALLSDYRVGDISVTLDPDLESYTCTLSYLLVWDLVIRFIVGQEKDAAHLMIHCLKRMGLFQRLLDTIFMLLPPLDERDLLKFSINSDRSQISPPDSRSRGLSYFLKSPLKTDISRQVNEIEMMALHVYFSMALHMPVTVRKWYNNNSSKRLTNLVNEYTVKHISQIICSLEMDSIQEKCQEKEAGEEEYTLAVKARPSAREVYAIYQRDEFKMELTVKLPVNYPLGSIQIDGGKRVGVTDQKWRSWLLQLTTFLSHQNGSILDGINLWRRNIDKKFEGIEKCLICFSILHSNYQLPKKKCSTCSKMFHNLCLYKWFETSGNSTCPLCRNTW